MPFSEDLIRRAQESWQRRSDRAVSREDAEEGLRNLVNFGLVLLEIHREAMRDGKKTDEHDQTVAGR